MLQQQTVSPARLTFYLRRRDDGRRFDHVLVDLGPKDLRRTLHSILATCKLPTSYVDNLPDVPKAKKSSAFPRTASKGPVGNWTVEWPDSPLRAQNYEKSSVDLDNIVLSRWLAKNCAEAEQRFQACRPIREEIGRLQAELCRRLELRDLLWDCGWGDRHFRGCLQSFQSLVTHHSDDMGQLRQRTVVFGRESGISLQGHVILNSGEVRHNWLDVIRNVERYEAPLKRVPLLEASLSRQLSDIHVTHRRFRPELLAGVYESQLINLTTSLGDYRGRHGYPKNWPERLNEFQLVVEGEAGPLMLSPSGQFITPAGIPPSLLVGFISDNMGEARERLNRLGAALDEEKQLVERCIRELGLSSLGKDDNVTPTQMIAACRRLLEETDGLMSAVPTGHQPRLWITHYYSLLSDGEMCLPWNWK